MFKRIIAALLATLALSSVAGHAVADTRESGFEQRNRLLQDYNQ